MVRFLILIYISSILCSNDLVAQPKDSTLSIKSIITATNNGFAIVPAFSLGKPAFLLDLAIGNRRLSFEPQFRYSLDGKPWIFNFNFRYKLLSKSRTQLMIGCYLPALNFVAKEVNVNGVVQGIQTVRRIISGELFINHRISENRNIGIYYLQGRGLQADGPRNIYYLALRAGFQKIRLYRTLYAEFSPQLYCLKVNDDIGFYINESIQIGLQNFPVSISSTINKAIQSTIPARNFDWNLAVSYSVSRQYVAKK